MSDNVPYTVTFVPTTTTLTISLGEQTREVSLTYDVCDECGAMVDTDSRQAHVRFHSKVAAMAKNFRWKEKDA